MFRSSGYSGLCGGGQPDNRSRAWVRSPRRVERPCRDEEVERHQRERQEEEEEKEGHRRCRRSTQERKNGPRRSQIGGYKRSFYRQLAGSVSSSCSRGSRSPSAEETRKEEEQETPWRAAVEDPYGPVGEESQKKKKKKDSEGSARKRKKRGGGSSSSSQKGSPTPSGGGSSDDSLGREQLLSCPEEDGPSSEEEVQETTGFSFTTTGGPSTRTTGSGGQSECRRHEPCGSDCGSETGIILLDHCAPPVRAEHGTDEGDAHADSGHGSSTSRTPRFGRRCLGGSVHVASPERLGRDMELGEVPGVVTAGGQLRCGAFSGDGGTSSCQIGGQGIQPGSMGLALWAERQRNKREELPMAGRGRASPKEKARRGPKGRGKGKANWHSQQGGDHDGDAGKKREEGTRQVSTKNDNCALAEAVRSTCRPERVQNNLSLEHDVFALADAVRSTCTSGREPGNLKPGSFALALEGCTTFGQLGCLLCWWIIGGWQIPDTESFTQEFFGSWLNLSVAKAQSSRTRSRGSTFPIRKGDLHAIEEVFGSEQLADVCKESCVSVWSRQAWTYVTLSSLNKLVGSSASLPAGKWSSAERRVFESVEKAVKIRLSKDDSAFQLSEAEWKKELEGRHVGYNGEEITTCQPLSLDQILPSLPPEEHGGCIDCLDWVGLRTKELLLHPEKLLIAGRTGYTAKDAGENTYN